MRIKLSKKDIKNNFKNIIGVGYCDLQNLLFYRNADFYSSGSYGWSCDYYKIDNNTIISTGYDFIDNMNVDNNLIKKYDLKARKILEKYNYTQYNIKKKKIDLLLKDFINEILK